MKHAHLPVFWYTLRTSWLSLLIWSLGLIAISVLYLSLYPSMAEMDLAAMVSQLPPALIEGLGFSGIASGSGYAQSTVFGLVGFVLLCVAGISWGGNLIGGAMQDGRLELILAHSVSRASYTLQVAASIIIRLGLIGFATAVIVIVLNAPAELNLNVANIWAVTTSWVGLATLVSVIALFVGALCGNSTVAVSVAGGITALAYLFQAIAKSVADFGWMSALSPYDWAYRHDPLTNGLDAGGLVLLWGAAAFFVLAAMVTLQWRDIKV